VHGEVIAPGEQTFAQILCEDAFLRHLPKRIALVLIAEGFVEGILERDLRVGYLKSAADLKCLDTRQLAATRSEN
jgi:hypothetical protein